MYSRVRSPGKSTRSYNARLGNRARTKRSLFRPVSVIFKAGTNAAPRRAVSAETKGYYVEIVQNVKCMRYPQRAATAPTRQGVRDVGRK